MTLKLTKRVCHLGNSFSSNTEHHGDDDVGAIDLSLDGIMLTAKDLDALLGDGAHAAIYVHPKANGKDAPLPEIRFPTMQPFKLKQEFEKVRVKLSPGYDSGITMTWQECKVKAITLTPQAGGLTMMKCSVRARPDAEDVMTLFEGINMDGNVAMSGGRQVEKGKDKQQHIPLGENTGDDKTGDDADARK